MSSLRATVALAAVAAALAGCQSADVGQRCSIQWGCTGPSDCGSSPLPPTPATTAADFLENGNPSCDNLVCIVSPVTSGKYAGCPGGNCGYCSKPCVSDQDCYRSETGLACRQMVLDPAFIAGLDPVTRDKYLGDVQFSSYCAVPR